MFWRKLLAAVLPLILCFLLVSVFAFLGHTFPNLPFLQNVLKGVVTGVAMALLIPLAGGRRRESFAGIFFIPAAVLMLAVGYQYLHQAGVWQAEMLGFLGRVSAQIVFMECAFLGFLATVAIRAVYRPKNPRSIS